MNFFGALWWVNVALSLAGYGVLTWWYVSRGPTFPPLSSVTVLHRERFASAWSHLSPITRLGGASNALGVTLTETELWLKTPVVFRGVIAFFDLVHRIAINDIDRIEDAGNTIYVFFNRNDSTPGTCCPTIVRPI